MDTRYFAVAPPVLPAAEPAAAGRLPGMTAIAELREELDAARELFETFDPDSPPYSVEPELRRLEALVKAWESRP